MAQGTTRRAVLAGVPAVAAVAALPVVAAIDPESEIMRLFAEWQVVRDRAVTASLEKFPSAAAYDAYVTEHLGERDDLEAEMVSHTPATAAEVAALVLAMTQWGEEPLLGYGFGDHLVATLNGLVGLTAGAAVAARPESASGVTEVERLFREWETYTRDEAWTDDISPLEARIASAPTTSIRDYAMKVIVWTMYGSEMSGATRLDKAMIDEMLALAGTSFPWPLHDGA